MQFRLAEEENALHFRLAIEHDTGGGVLDIMDNENLEFYNPSDDDDNDERLQSRADECEEEYPNVITVSGNRITVYRVQIEDRRYGRSIDNDGDNDDEDDDVEKKRKRRKRKKRKKRQTSSKVHQQNKHDHIG